MYINGTKLHFGATEMKSKANTPTWHDGPCLLRLQPVLRWKRPPVEHFQRVWRISRHRCVENGPLWKCAVYRKYVTFLCNKHVRCVRSRHSHVTSQLKLSHAQWSRLGAIWERLIEYGMRIRTRPSHPNYFRPSRLEKRVILANQTLPYVYHPFAVTPRPPLAHDPRAFYG